MITFNYESSGHPGYMKMTGVLDRYLTVHELIKELMITFPNKKGTIKVGKYCMDFKNSCVDITPIDDLKDKLVDKVTGIDSYGVIDLTISVAPVKKEKNEGIVKFESMLKDLHIDMHKILDEYEDKFGVKINSIEVSKQGSLAISTQAEYGELVFDFKV